MKFRALIVGLGVVVTLAGCKITQPVQHTISRTDTIIERERLVPIKVESTSVTTRLSPQQLDSLKAALQNLPAGNRTIYYTDKKLQTRLSYSLDSIGNLVTRCETLEKTLFEMIKERDRIIERKELEIRLQRETFGQKLSTFFNNGILFIVLALAAFTGINWFINRRK